MPKSYQILSFYIHCNRVITPGKTSGTTQTITKAPVGSVYQKVFKNNMNEDSYENDFDQSVKRLLSEHHATLWSQEAFIATTHEFSNCLVGKSDTYKNYIKVSISTLP